MAEDNTLPTAWGPGPGKGRLHHKLSGQQLSFMSLTPATMAWFE